MLVKRRRSYERLGACVLSIAVVLATVPPVGAADKVLGTIQVNGPAYAASANADWSQITAPRPLVAGDRLKTGRDGYLVADLGGIGVIGLFGDTEVSVADSSAGLVIDVQKGKAAFHMESGSRMRVTVKGASILPTATSADGYVEYDSTGTPIVVMEGGALDVKFADGTTKTVSRGERLALTGKAQPEPAPVASADDERKATGSASPPEKVKKKYAGLTPLGWTAVGVAAAAVAGGAAALAGGGGGGGGGDNSPSGQ